MNCHQCGFRFKLATGGMGNSDAPGVYFCFGIAFLAGALILLVLHSAAWAGLLALFAAIMIGWSFTARGEVISSECPACEHKNPIHPWSI